MTLHLLARLDAIRETQLTHGQLIARIVETMQTMVAATPQPTSHASWKSIAAAAGQWAGAVLALGYLVRGGDAGKALDMLQQLF